MSSISNSNFSFSSNNNSNSGNNVNMNNTNNSMTNNNNNNNISSNDNNYASSNTNSNIFFRSTSQHTNNYQQQQQQQHYHQHHQQYTLKCTDLPQFDALVAQADLIQSDDKLHLRNLCNDSARCAALTAVHTTTSRITVINTDAGVVATNNNNNTLGTLPTFQRNSKNYNYKNNDASHNQDTQQQSPPLQLTTVPLTRTIILDYSRQRVTGETMELLFDLADAVGLTDRREQLRVGKCVNATENKPFLSHILRMPLQQLMDPSDDIQIQWQQQHSNNNNNSISAAHHHSSTDSIDIGMSYHSCNNNNNNNTESDNYQRNRTQSGTNIGDDGHNASPYFQQVVQTRNQITQFANQVRSGEYRSVTNEPFRNTLVIGLGGFTIGTEVIHHALMADQTAATTSQGRNIRFLSNVDPVAFTIATRDWKASETLVVVNSRQFLATETTLNARTARNWLVENLATANNSSTKNDSNENNNKDDDDTNNGVITEKFIVERHFVAAVNFNMTRLLKFGLLESNIFVVGDWANPRFSWCSAAGLLPLSIQYSPEIIMNDLLAGAHNVDVHFFNAPLRDNIPVILGLLGVWNSTFLGYNCRAICPYSHALSKLPQFVQHVNMESNGKRVALDGTPLLHRSGEVDFGAVGVDGQYMFFQLLHQGRVTPVDFVGFMESQQPIDLKGEAVAHHDELMSNFFAQPDALAYGKTLVDLIQEGTPEPLREHMVFTGNRPSSSLLMTRLDAFAIGQLLALIEHRTIVQGFIWGINSFDQFGIDLGRVLAKHVRSQISASRKTGASVQGFNSSTSSLLEYYILHGRQQEQNGR